MSDNNLKIMENTKKKRLSQQEVEELQIRLEEAEETLRAIRSGEVDALVVSGSEGEQLYTLQGADRSYRILLETMGEGAATLGSDGAILYCNRRLADMLKAPIERVIGSSIKDYLSPGGWESFRSLLTRGTGVDRREIDLRTAEGTQTPALICVGSLPGVDIQGFVMTAADLTKQRLTEERLRELAFELINAQETERKRIAHELHDGLAALLAAIKYKVEHRFKNGGSVLPATTLEETMRDIETAITETRRIMANLRPSVLDDLGIVPALTWYSRETGKTYPETSVEYSGNVQERDVPERLKIVIFRIVQEATRNAVRHGKSSRIKIGLTKEKNWLRLSVEDNGNGFEAVRRSETNGIGLDSMQQRVDFTGGIFSISSTPGKGTTVKAEWRIN